MRGTLETARRLFNAALLAAALVAGGCGKEPAPVETADAAEPEVPLTPTSRKREKPDAALPDPVPVAPLDLLLKLPEPPSSLLARPGDKADALLKDKSLAASPYTDSILVSRPGGGAFRQVHYQLDSRRERVRAVLASFDPAYLAPDRRAAVEEAARLRLGEPQKLRSPHFEGLVWKGLEYRIELRNEKKSGDMELLFHARGASDPLDPPPP